MLPSASPDTAAARPKELAVTAARSVWSTCNSITPINSRPCITGTRASL